MNINQNTLNEIQGLLIFGISNKEFCTDIKNLKTVIKIAETKFKDEFKDEVYFDDRLFKIIDIQKMLKIRLEELTTNTRIILFETFGKMFGFFVDRIIEIITTDTIFKQQYLDMIPSSKEDYISGELIIEKRKILMLDFEKISKELAILKKVNLGLKHYVSNTFFSD